MAFFKFRKGSDATPAATAQPESVEALRRRARHRLIGAAVLVLVGVIGFPLLFDTQPRPIAVDIPIEIPDRAKVKPLPAPPQSHMQGAVTPDVPAKAAATPASAGTQAAAPAVAATATSKPASSTAAREQAPVAEASKPAPVQPAKVESTARAQEADGRFVVQVGAFVDAGKARETRLRVEKAGLKTYTNVAETRDGKRIRVRVGPFGSRAEADKAASRIKELDLPASILTL
jgi:DedD protein